MVVVRQKIKELDENKPKAIYSRFQQIVTEQLPIFCLVNPISFQAVRDRMTPVKFSVLGRTLWNIDELKVDNQD
ncbi:hypothetical protein [Nostoc sp. CCY0012]|uniref:hypothetical protein n=1 Tax=Nostoc sp. CCY0012 TaxID=1056123 RepID=UPI0039C7323A